MKSHLGKFITFEGSEGCGKSTQIAALEQHFKALGLPTIVLREPGGTPLGEQIRHLLKFAKEAKNMTPETELLLFAASRTQLVQRVIQPALDAGSIVLCDRFCDSTTVYQGIARKIDIDVVEQINTFACHGCLPDVTILLDMDAEKAMARALRRPRPAGGMKDRMEQEPLEFYRAIRKGYLCLAQNDPERIHVFNADQSANQITEEIRNFLTERFYGIFTKRSV